MTGVDNKKDSLPCLTLRSASVWKGVPRAVVAPAPSGGAAAVAVLYSIHPAHLPARAGPVRRPRPGPGTTHGHRRAAGGPGGRRGAPHRVPPRLLPRPLSDVDAGPRAGRGGAGAGPARSAGGLPGGRHDAAAQGQARVGQGTAPGQRPLDAQPHGVGLRAQVGRAGGQRAVRLRQPPLGVAGAGGAVPPAGAQRARGPAAAPDADRPGPAARGGAGPLVPRAAVHPAGRRRLRLARAGPVLPPPPSPRDAGRAVPPAGQPVRPAAGAGAGRPGRPRVKGDERPRRATLWPGRNASARR